MEEESTSSPYFPSLTGLENKMRGQKGEGTGQGWNWQREYLSKCWHLVSPMELEHGRLFGFLPQAVEPAPLKICTGKGTFNI